MPDWQAIYFAANPFNSAQSRCRFTGVTRIERAAWGVTKKFLSRQLCNGWADCSQICCVFWEPLASASAKVRRVVSARAHVHNPILWLYVWNGWTDCGKTWCAARDPPNMHLPQVKYEVPVQCVHVRTCTPLCVISGTTRPIVFKFNVRLGTSQIRVFHESRKWCSARAHVHNRPLYLPCNLRARSFTARKGTGN